MKTGTSNQASGISKNKRARLRAGFTVLFAALIASLLLAVGLAIFDIIFREVSFATVVRDSSYANYAADTGVECAEYWDYQCQTAGVCTGLEQAFATSSDSAASGLLASSDDLVCAGQKIMTDNGIKTDAGGSVGTIDAPDPLDATTTFAIYVDKDDTNGNCAIVEIAKYGRVDSDGPYIATEIISNGYNTCNAGPNRVERTDKVSY